MRAPPTEAIDVVLRPTRGHADSVPFTDISVNTAANWGPTEWPPALRCHQQARFRKPYRGGAMSEGYGEGYRHQILMPERRPRTCFDLLLQRASQRGERIRLEAQELSVASE
jgi:hypothetical protein